MKEISEDVNEMAAELRDRLDNRVQVVPTGERLPATRNYLVEFRLYVNNIDLMTIPMVYYPKSGRWELVTNREWSKQLLEQLREAIDDQNEMNEIFA